MDRAEVVRIIIMTISKLKEDTNSFFSKDSSLFSDDGRLIKDLFLQKFKVLKDNIKNKIRELPVDEYLAVELDAWIKVLSIKILAFDTNSTLKEYESMAVEFHYCYNELIELLTDLKLEVIENEFDARVDSILVEMDAEKTNYGPNTLIISPSVLSALVSFLYNYNLIAPSADVDSICCAFSSLTGFSANSIKQHVALDSRTGRLKSLVKCDDLVLLRKILRSMLSRLDYVISYNERNQQ